MKSYFDHFMKSCIDWWFRPKSVGFYAMTCGLGLITLVLAASWAFRISLPVSDGRFDFSMSSGEGTPAVLTCILGGAGVFLLVGGFIFEVKRVADDRRRSSKKRVLVIEGRGLRDGPGSPLIDAVPAQVAGHREPILLDLRQKIEDGRIAEPAALIQKIEALAAQVEQRASGLDRSDLTLVYGGLTAVPFTFLTGVIMDDEVQVLVLDWDRRVQRWRALDDGDDGKRFSITGLEEASPSSEVVLAASVSYPITDEDLRSTFPSLPVIRLSLEDAGPNSHWSDVKQGHLADQFLRAAIDLGGRGVRRIHLVLAAPNSVVFRFGRCYDKRNLPELVAYQFEKGATPAYPWGVLMPTGQVRRASIVRP